MVVPTENRSKVKNAGIVITKNHKNITSITKSIVHTFRDGDPSDYPHVDLNKTQQNLDLLGATNSAELLELLDQRLNKAKRLTTKSNICIEFLVTADFNAFIENGGSIFTEKFVSNTKELLVEFFGEENIIGFNVQLDELTPHIVAYVVPLIYRPERNVTTPQKAGTYLDGSARYINVFKNTEAYTSLSSTHYYDLFGGKKGMQTLFAEFIFEKNGLRRGFLFSQRKHTDARDHNLLLKTGYSRATADIEINAEILKSIPGLRFMSFDKMSKNINKLLLKIGQPTFAMAAEYINEKNKNTALEETLVLTQEKYTQLKKNENNLKSKIEPFERLSKDNQQKIRKYIAHLEQQEKDDAQRKLDEKEKERTQKIEEIKSISIDEFIQKNNEERPALWRFCIENPELEDKFEEFYSTDLFNPEDGSLSKKGVEYKRKFEEKPKKNEIDLVKNEKYQIKSNSHNNKYNKFEI